MSNQYFNFSYDPVRQGYDSDTWSTVLGVPVVANHKLVLANSEIIHKSDLLRGEFTFGITAPAPALTHDMKIGLAQNNAESFMGFIILNDTIRAEVNLNAQLDDFQPLTWDDSWTDTNTEFRIKWEAGKVDFFINGQFKWTNSSDLVTNDPMNLYIFNDTAAAVPLYVNYINVEGVQSMI